MKHKVRKIHFVGIGGAGMSGIAEVLLNLGYSVSGSDMNRSAVLERLESLGAKVHVGHQAEHVEDADCVVVSTAVRADNPEVRRARARRVLGVPRALMLAELMKLKQGVAIAGTHGKTTTTSLVASILAKAGLDPTFVIGGRLNSAGVNARLGSGDYIVVEADESDASFLNLLPMIAAVTNIDADHMDTYGHDMARLKQAFVDFLNRLPFYGSAVLCLDDPHVREIVPFVSKPTITYGLGEDAQVRAVDVRAEGDRMHFQVLRENEPPLEVSLALSGEHNVRNALAAIAIATELGVKADAIVAALAEFRGVGRRFERYGEVPVPVREGSEGAQAGQTAAASGTFTLIDDYGHHPVEIEATLRAVRGAFPTRRLVLAFQPHRYSRTRDLFEDFVRVLGMADQLILTEVYAAGEPPIVAAARAASVPSLRRSWPGCPPPRLPDKEPSMSESLNPLPFPVQIDPDALGRVVVLMGGHSSERNVSLDSGRNVLKALQAKGVDAEAFDPAERSLGDLEKAGYDRAFIALHGRYGEDGTIQGVLEMLGIPYTGSGVMASAVAIDKISTKQMWQAGRLPTPPWEVLLGPHQLAGLAERLGLPLIIKPPHEGSTLGLTRVDSLDRLPAAYERAADIDFPVLAERFVQGRELTVAVIGSGAAARALPIVEIRAPNGNYDYRNKYFTDDTRYLCPAPLVPAMAADIASLAEAAYRAVGCEGWGRVDIMLDDGTQRPWLLEVNTSPGMTGHSLVPMAARAAGISYEDLVLGLTAQASLKIQRRVASEAIA